ncbi:hypothetical protein [Streptomyces sp. NPDC048340]|uniref:hypothetical protein n=1 Tax=Streptomyces sp. NPDC048340 TaxID=3365537 RepID=UPI0037138803
MDNNEQRHGTAGRGPGAISLPAVAWHAAGEEPAAAPVAPRPSLTLPVLQSEPEPVTEPEPGAAPAGGAVPEVPAAAGEEVPEAEGTEERPQAAEESSQEAAPDAPDALAAASLTAPVAAPAAPTGLRPARRIPKPMLAAAATSGVVLMGVPLLFSQLGGDAGPGRVPPRPAGYNQPDGGPEGFVPGTDADKGSVLPGAVVPGTAADAPGQGAANAPVTNTGAGGGEGQGSPGGGPAGGPAAGSGGTSGNQGDPGSGGSPDTGARQDPQQSRPDQQAPPPAPAKKEYAAVAGPGCAGEGAAFSRNGWYTDGKEGWKSYGTGGYGSSGCNGDFLAMPMSGHSGKDAGNHMLWTFRTGAVTTGTCQVSMHVPNNGDVKAVGGKPAYYTVHGAASASGPTLGSFNVDQPSQLGRWVGAGSFRITGGQLAVKLHDRGQDWSGSTKTYDHLAGDAVRVQCTSS